MDDFSVRSRGIKLTCSWFSAVRHGFVAICALEQKVITLKKFVGSGVASSLRQEEQCSFPSKPTDHTQGIRYLLLLISAATQLIALF